MPASARFDSIAGATARRHGRARCALFAYGFRPFFLLAGLHAAVAIPVWIAWVHGFTAPGAPLPALAWHAHEMLYGFVAAAVAGFLLTAVPSWTGQRGFAGAPLIGLALLWLAGRCAVSIPLGLDPAVIATVDLAFFPALALTVLPSLIRSGNRRNVIFVGLLALLFAANLHFHLAGAESAAPLRLAVNTVLLIVTLVGGRIVPAFTSAALKHRGVSVRIPRHVALDGGSLLAVFAVLVVDIVRPDSAIAGVVAVLAASMLALRLVRWQGHRTLREPMVWVLHLAYAWLPVALMLKAAWLLVGWMDGTAWVHALTAGAFSTMILGVMSRASLGHTGRPLIASRATATGYVLLSAAALTRVFGPLLDPATWTLWLGAAAALWSAAFGLFVVVYAPILWTPRADGRPG